MQAVEKIRQTVIPVSVTNHLNGFYPPLSLYVDYFHSSFSILNWERLTLISFQRDVSVIYHCNIYFVKNNIGSLTLLRSLVAVLVISDFTLLLHFAFPKFTLLCHLLILFLRSCRIYTVFSIRKVNTLKIPALLRVLCMKSRGRHELLRY